MCIIGVLSYCNIIWGRRGRDHMLVEFTTVYAITTKFVRSKHVHSEVYSIQHYVISLPVTCDRSVFSPGNPVSFTNKSDHHHIADILFIVL